MTSIARKAGGRKETRQSIHAYTRNRVLIDGPPDGWVDNGKNIKATWLEEGGWSCSSYVVDGHRYHRRHRLVFGDDPASRVEWYLKTDGES